MIDPSALLTSSKVKLQRDLEDIRLFPNAASKGYEAEAALRKLLKKYLPKKYSIGSGFIFGGNGWSKQHDLIVYDDLINTPLHEGDSNGLYLAGSVYGVVETSMALLTKQKLTDDIQKLAHLRRMMPNEKVKFVRIRRKKVGPNQWVSGPLPFESSPPPRAYMVYMSGTTYATLETLALDLHEIAVSSGAHIHGLMILDKSDSEKIPITREWFLRMTPYSQGQVEVTDVDGFRKLIESMKVSFASLKVGKYPAYGYFDELENAKSS